MRPNALDSRAAALLFYVVIHDGGAATFGDVGAATLSVTQHDVAPRGSFRRERGGGGGGDDDVTMFPLMAADADCRCAAMCRMLRRGPRWALDALRSAHLTVTRSC